MIKICKQKKGNEQEVKPNNNNKRIISLSERKEAKEKDSGNNEEEGEEEEKKGNGYVGYIDRKTIAKKKTDYIFKIIAVDEVKNSKKNIVQMKELKLIPTQIFWLQIITLLPLIPLLPVIFYPYYVYIHQFQIVWAASLLAFKSGARWTSATLQPKQSDVKINNKKNSSWSWCESWGSLASAVTPACLAAFALFLSFPFNHIILTYAFVRILIEDFSKKNPMPKGYLELEVFTSTFAVVAILFVFVINIIYLALK